MNRLASTKNRLAEKLCRDPTPSEIGQVSGLSNQQVQQITNFSHAPISLESLVTATAGGDVYDLTEDQNSLSLTESTDARNLRGRLESLITIDEDGYVDYLIQDLDSGSVAKETDMRFLRERIQVVLSTLTDRERQVILLRFGLSDGWARTLEEIGRELDRTRERIRQIEARALGKLRHPSRARRLKGFLNGP